jgi:hypothetical protein
MAEIRLEGYGTFELPEQFKLKEMRTIERYTQGVMGGYELSKISGVIHVAISRAKPDLSFDEIQAVVDEINVADLDKILVQVGQSPPSATETDSGPSASNGSSNGVSSTSSDADPGSETQPSTGSLDLAGFRSSPATSES